jgi:hypothetical protein
MWRNFPEDSNLHSHFHEKLKSHIYIYMYTFLFFLITFFSLSLSVLRYFGQDVSVSKELDNRYFITGRQSFPGNGF